MTSLRRTALAALLLLLVCPGAASAKWMRLRSSHFVAVGDAPERALRDTLQQLELFRDVMAAVLPAQATRVTVPTVVVVFASDASFAQYRPTFQGRAVEVGGYFLRRQDMNYIALKANRGQTSLRTVFHEYAHAIVSNAVGPVPVWASEGLAEFYSTFETRNGGKSALIGMPNNDALIELRSATPMPLSELFAVTHDSSSYNEGDRRGMLYAESWAMVHYLTLGNPARTPQWRRYLQLLKSGTPPPEAITQAFGSDYAALERELREYVRKFAFMVTQLDFDSQVVVEQIAAGEDLSDATAASYLGDLLDRLGRTDAARALLQKTATANPDNGTVSAVLGSLELKTGNIEAGLPLVARAATLAPADARALSAYGRGLLLTARDDGREESVARAVQLLSRALELEPENAFTALTLARAELWLGTNLPRAVMLLRQVLAGDPERDDVRLLLADALVEQESLDEAVNTLGVLLARGRTQEARDEAREKLAVIARLRIGRARLDAIAATASPAPEPVTAPPNPSRPGSAGGRVILDLRQLAPGEERLQGIFTAVECSQGSIALVIAQSGRRLRFTSATFDEVEFISYRDATPGNVPCGNQTQLLPVIVTYRASTGGAVTGQAVAIEVVPDGYVLTTGR